MAAKVETLRTTRPNIAKRRAVLARLAAAALEWARDGQLDGSTSSEMRRYTGAR
jgi:hypothetical protein